jgi:hypothetical protein
LEYYKSLAVLVLEQNGQDEVNTSLFQLLFVCQALRTKQISTSTPADIYTMADCDSAAITSPVPVN